MQRLAGLEHHVVGDVDGQRDRADARGAQPVDHPGRGRGGRVDALDRQRDERGAAVRLERHRVAAVDRLGQVRPVAVLVADAVGDGRLAGQAPHRQAVAQVGGHVDVEHLVGAPQQVDRVGAGLGRAVREHHDAAVVLAEAQFVLGADHAVGDVAVGLAGRDGEVAGQHGTGQRHDDQVADGEVVGAADDAAACGELVGRVVVEFLSDVDAAVADRLAVLLRLLDETQHPADHEGAGDGRAGLLDVLDGQADLGELVGEPGGVGVCRERDEVTQPRDRGLHRAPPRIERLKRMSPSTKSRRSGAPVRNITVRSTPMPKAKPE